MGKNLEDDVENDPLEENCQNCDGYIKINLRARCEEKNNMGEMKKKGYPCFSRHFSVMGYSGSPKDEFS
jgi:hypothetical protein